MPGSNSTTIQSTAIVWDSHSCLPLASGIDLSVLRRHKASGFDYVSINVGMDMNPLDQVMKTIAWFRHWIAQHPEEFVQVDGFADVAAAKKAGKLAVSFDLEGPGCCSRTWRWWSSTAISACGRCIWSTTATTASAAVAMTTTRASPPSAARWCAPSTRPVVIMDCSHNGERTSLDIMATSDKPVVFSHANARALVDHPRNISDRQIDACAATGGVIGINGIRLFLDAKEDFAEPMARHIDYMVQRVGPDHVGLGIDISFDLGVDDHPAGEDRGYWWPLAGRRLFRKSSGTSKAMPVPSRRGTAEGTWRIPCFVMVELGYAPVRRPHPRQDRGVPSSTSPGWRGRPGASPPPVPGSPHSPRRRAPGSPAWSRGT